MVVVDHPFDLRLVVNSVEMERATRTPKDRQCSLSSLARVSRSEPGMAAYSAPNTPPGSHGAETPSTTAPARLPSGGATRMLRLSQVIERTQLGKTTIYALQKSGRFPHSVILTANSVRWIEAEVEDWLASHVAERAPPRTR
jgi:prophage regulatory protein